LANLGLGVKMRIPAVVLALSISAILSSCQTTTQTPENKAVVSQIPNDYKQQTVAYFKKTLKDPYTVRDAEITEPTVIFVGLVNGTTAPGVCVRMNAKNSFGAYTGVEAFSVAFKSGKVFLVNPPLFDTCTKANWRAFPEMNGSQ